MDVNHSTVVNSFPVVAQKCSPTAPLVQYIYMMFALACLAANLVIGYIFARNKQYFKKSGFMAGLAIGDTFQGVGTLVLAVMRLGYIQNGTTCLPVHPFECLKTFTTLVLIGAQLPSVMIMLISCERAIAVIFYIWYYQNWSPRKEWFIVGCGFLFVTVSISASWIITYNFPAYTTTQINCGTGAAIGADYASYHYYLAAASGAVSVYATLASMITFMIQKKQRQSNANENMKKFIKKEWQVTISTCVIAFLDLALVVIPNLMNALLSMFPSIPSIGTYAICMLCFRSASNLFIYLIFNKEFRSKFFTSFHGGAVNTNAVHPSTEMIVLHRVKKQIGTKQSGRC